MWDIVRAKWDPDSILLERGAQFVKAHSIRTCNHELNVFVTLLAGFGPLTNGANIKIFPGHDSPLNMIAVLVGYPQTKKSQMTKLVKEIGEALDKRIQRIATAMIEKAADDGHGGLFESADDLELTSAVLSSFTPAVMFERCSGDYCHAKNPENFTAYKDLKTSLHLGRLGNIDEGYPFLIEFGLLEETRRRGSASASSGTPNPHAGTLNRFLQFGECARATRTAGVYGEGEVPSTSFSCIANIHPEVAVPMERGEMGNHTGQTKERLLMYGAPRVQAHEALPADFILPEGAARWVWIDLEEELATLSGLEEYFQDPELARRHEKLVLASEESDAVGAEVDFLPNAGGYVFTLPDGVESRLRWKIEVGVPVAQIRISNRDFELPEEFSIVAASNRVLDRFSKKNRKIVRDDAAMNKAKSIQTLYSVKVAMAVDAGREEESARWGIASWLLGVMNGLLYSFDVAVGNPTPDADDSNAPIRLPRSYVERAHKVLDLLVTCRNCYAGGETSQAGAARRQALDDVSATFLAEPVDHFAGLPNMPSFSTTAGSDSVGDSRAPSPAVPALRPKAPTAQLQPLRIPPSRPKAPIATSQHLGSSPASKASAPPAIRARASPALRCSLIAAKSPNPESSVPPSVVNSVVGSLVGAEPPPAENQIPPTAVNSGPGAGAQFFDRSHLIAESDPLSPPNVPPFPANLMVGGAAAAGLAGGVAPAGNASASSAASSGLGAVPHFFDHTHSTADPRPLLPPSPLPTPASIVAGGGAADSAAGGDREVSVAAAVEPMAPTAPAKAEKDGIALSVGYGRDGQQVQQIGGRPTHIQLTDREVMQKTLNIGKPIVTSKQFCDSNRVAVPNTTSDNSVKRRRTAFPRPLWEAIMEAGFAIYKVGKLEHAGTTNSRVVFFQPPLPSADRATKVAYNNALVDLCQMSARRFTTLLMQNAQAGAVLPGTGADGGVSGEVGGE